MFDLHSIAPYVAVVIGMFLIPGPAVLLVITHTLQGGRKVGIYSGLGIACGDLIHTLCHQWRHGTKGVVGHAVVAYHLPQGLMS